MKVVYDMIQVERCAQHIKDSSIAFQHDSVRQISNIILKEIQDLSLGNFNPLFTKFGVVFVSELNQLEYENILEISVYPKEELEKELELSD